VRRVAVRRDSQRSLNDIPEGGRDARPPSAYPPSSALAALALGLLDLDDVPTCHLRRRLSAWARAQLPCATSSRSRRSSRYPARGEGRGQRREVVGQSAFGVDLIGDDEVLVSLGVRAVQDRGELEEVILREAIETLVQPGLSRAGNPVRAARVRLPRGRCPGPGWRDLPRSRRRRCRAVEAAAPCAGDFPRVPSRAPCRRPARRARGRPRPL
jgi:hypothetical protein